MTRSIRVLTLLALAQPIGRLRRGGVIVDGGHGECTIDIILGPNWPEFCILHKANSPLSSRHHSFQSDCRGTAITKNEKSREVEGTAASGPVEPHVDAEKIM